MNKLRAVWTGLCLLFVSGLSAQTTFPDLPESMPAGSGMIQSCKPYGIDRPVECGRFRVYENRAENSGRTIDLAFVVLRATQVGASGKQVVIPLPGGPGQGFTNDTGLWVRAWSHFRERNDILIVDIRGVGESAPLGCPQFTIPVQERFGSVFPVEHIRACHAALSDQARLDLYTSDLVVDDLDELRHWLGYSQVNLTGGSYGTRLAQIYVRRHPDEIRSVIMNSVAPVFMTTYVYMAQSLQNALNLVLRDCAEDKQCSEQYPQLGKRVDSLIRQLSEAPVTVDLGNQSIKFSLGDFSYALRGLLYSRAEEVPRILWSASEGAWTGIARYYLQRTGWIADPSGPSGHHFSALCAEDIAPLDDLAVQKLTAETFMGDHLISGYRQTCEIWDVAELPEEWWTPVNSDLPVLLISGERDPVTPPGWADAVAQYLPNSTHLVWPDGGHVPRNDCLRSIEQQFLDAASVESLDTACMERTLIQ